MNHFGLKRSILVHLLKCMPTSQIGIAAISNCSDLKSQSASEIATRIAFKSVEKRVEIAAEIAVIRIAAISNCYTLKTYVFSTN